MVKRGPQIVLTKHVEAHSVHGPWCITPKRGCQSQFSDGNPILTGARVLFDTSSKLLKVLSSRALCDSSQGFLATLSWAGVLLSICWVQDGSFLLSLILLVIIAYVDGIELPLCCTLLGWRKLVTIGGHVALFLAHVTGDSREELSLFDRVFPQVSLWRKLCKWLIMPLALNQGAFPWHQYKVLPFLKNWPFPGQSGGPLFAILLPHHIHPYNPYLLGYLNGYGL